MFEVPEECMHRHALPLCIGHLALFQCHRSIYISKEGDQEGFLCAPFLTQEMIWFISSSTEIYAFGGPLRRSYPQLMETRAGKRGTCNPCDHRPNGPPCHSAWFMWCGWLSPSAPRLSVKKHRGGGVLEEHRSEHVSLKYPIPTFDGAWQVGSGQFRRPLL